MLFYISQSCIIIGYLLFFMSRFQKRKYTILMTDTVSRFCHIVGYYLFGSLNTVEHTIYGILRNVLGQILVGRKTRSKIICFFIMILFLYIMYGVSFNGVSTVLFMVSGLMNLFAVIFTKEQGIRLGTVFASICNIIAFFVIGSYISILGESLCGLVGILSFYKGGQKNEDGI